MTEQQFENEISVYRDQFRFIHPGAGTVSGNGTRFLSEYLFTKLIHGWLKERDIDLSWKAYASIEETSGLLIRHPKQHRDQQESVDDYLSRISAAKLIGCGFEKRFLAYGRDPKNEWGIPYCYNNLIENKFTLDSFLGRFQGLIAHAQWAAGEVVPLWRKVIWSISMGPLTIRKTQDGHLLNAHMEYVYNHPENKDKHWICDLGVKLWQANLKFQYRHGLGHVLYEYFGFLHPLASGLMDVFSFHDTKTSS